MNRLEAHILETIRAHALVSAGDSVLVAVSGGADSMALLLILSALQKRLGVHLHAAHYEHGIRGEASLADARFVAAFCQARGIPFSLGQGDVPSLARQWKCSLEDAARRARYAYLDQTAQAVGAARIALAHHLGDQAETLLLHLAHGCGLQGLSGMRMLSGNRMRPLLDVTRAQIEAYLHDRGVAWREDETNGDMRYARNLIRHELMPVLRRLNPQVEQALARTAGLAADAAARLEAQAELLLVGRVKRMPYGAFWETPMDDPPEVLLPAEAVRAFARWAGVPPLDAQQTMALTETGVGASCNLPGDWRAFRTRARLHLLSPKPVQPALDPGDFTWTQAQDDDLGDGVLTQVFDADAVAGAQFRWRRQGDLFRPLGAAGTQKLKQTLIDAGIDRPFRDLLPVLAKEGRILWIVGVRPAQDAAVSGGTARRVRITYHGTLPWTITEMDVWRENE